MTREQRLEEALRAARDHIAEDLEALVECGTLAGPDGAPDLTTLDDITRAAVSEIERTLADIDAALAPSA